ncbi:hypothetical protein [Magnetospirillum sulfuroxidans]|uniref:DNA-binding protein n=1 Tax=Magnetospirillum sulfuroxidans TaxID=611300 RepID=A0ABS5I8V5_9PROT|nr:hypothetical protein [Magnetospirillum sulfuroxidans]MBR9970836.1 hypothetical protein [Magnetospirillum sulfuroxidans]
MADSIAEDLLQGAKAIAEFTGFKRRQIYNLADNHHPAIKKEPGLGLVASKSALLRHYAIAPDKLEDGQ